MLCPVLEGKRQGILVDAALAEEQKSKMEKMFSKI